MGLCDFIIHEKLWQQIYCEWNRKPIENCIPSPSPFHVILSIFLTLLLWSFVCCSCFLFLHLLLVYPLQIYMLQFQLHLVTSWLPVKANSDSKRENLTGPAGTGQYETNTDFVLIIYGERIKVFQHKYVAPPQSTLVHVDVLDLSLVRQNIWRYCVNGLSNDSAPGKYWYFKLGGILEGLLDWMNQGKVVAWP